MTLLVDAGNTRIKWRFKPSIGMPQEGVGSLADPGLFRGLAGATVRRIAVSTVVSEDARHRLRQRLQDDFRAEPIFHWTQKAQCGLVCAYENPETMGADRWHALVGAWREVGRRLLVVDAGSALTIDSLDDKGAHLGGYILPGHRLMRESLESKTARVSFGKTLSLDISPGATTDACVRNGLSWLWSSVIDRLERMRDEMGIDEDAVFLTGGDAPGLMQLGMSGRLRPQLVLDGLEAVDAEVGGV
ncbi:type III pantothenate kinase [Marinobacter fonticola]|uniref:type III pantothenate kinase n=1 Tax=Marinobacter fonticola TaxID=2603215 RepID=UPI0011E86E7D|nr:type III pantothenate kinase [Marinobacter fonticola]